jgi:hypothetical protein
VIAPGHDFPALNSLYGEAEGCITNPQPRRVSLLNWQRDEKGVALDLFASAFTYAWEFTALTFWSSFAGPDTFGMGLQRSPTDKPKGHKQ